jgi:hypothetical protein
MDGNISVVHLPLTCRMTVFIVHASNSDRVIDKRSELGRLLDAVLMTCAEYPSFVCFIGERLVQLSIQSSDELIDQ